MCTKMVIQSCSQDVTRGFKNDNTKSKYTFAVCCTPQDTLQGKYDHNL